MISLYDVNSGNTPVSTMWKYYVGRMTHKYTVLHMDTVPAFQHGPSLDTLLCRFGVEPPYLGSVEAKFICQNCPLKTKLTGNLLQCLQVNYSILKKTENKTCKIT